LVDELVSGPRTSVYTKGKNGRGSMEVKVPKIQFSRPIYALSWSIGFYGERGKRGGLVGKGRGPWQTNAVKILF
jgi:hypothetical protein